MPCSLLTPFYDCLSRGSQRRGVSPPVRKKIAFPSKELPTMEKRKTLAARKPSKPKVRAAQRQGGGRRFPAGPLAAPHRRPALTGSAKRTSGHSVELGGSPHNRSR